jgi:sugar phosphate isomerase/epimerase
VVALAQKAGIGYIEWGGDIHVTNEDDARNVKSLCDNADIKISSYGSYFNCADYDEDKWIQVCKIAKEMDAESIRVWLGKKDSEITSEEEYDALVSNTKKMCDVASEYGLLVCPECHDNTYNNNTYAFLKLRDELNEDNFKTYFQSRYLRYDYDIDRIEKTFDFTENFHVSYRDLKREQRFRKKDRKYLDKLVRKFMSMDFQGIVIMEFTKGSKEKNFIKDVRKLKVY